MKTSSKIILIATICLLQLNSMMSQAFDDCYLETGEDWIVSYNLFNEYEYTYECYDNDSWIEYQQMCSSFDWCKRNIGTANVGTPDGYARIIRGLVGGYPDPTVTQKCCKKYSSWRCTANSDNTCDETIRRRSLEEEELEEMKIAEALAKETPLERLSREREVILAELSKLIKRVDSISQKPETQMLKYRIAEIEATIGIKRLLVDYKTTKITDLQKKSGDKRFLKTLI